MTLVRPRLTDYYGVMVAQAEVDFAIPFLDEDLPLAVDPFSAMEITLPARQRTAPFRRKRI
jgi:hypothetical protein